MSHLQYATRECQCGACGLYFIGVTYFDQHRDGDMDHRRCLSVKEMKQRGMVKDDKGRWGMGASQGRAGQDEGQPLR